MEVLVEGLGELGMVGGGGTLAEKFALLARLGFDGVELDSPNGLDRSEVLDARDASGLPIHGVVDSVHWSKPLSSPDEPVRREGIEALVTARIDTLSAADRLLLREAAVLG